MQDRVEQYNRDAAENNAARKKENLATSGKQLFYFCALDESPLVKKKKNVTRQIGLNKSIDLPQYRCTVCGSKYAGFKGTLRLLSNESITAVVVEYDGVA